MNATRPLASTLFVLALLIALPFGCGDGEKGGGAGGALGTGGKAGGAGTGGASNAAGGAGGATSTGGSTAPDAGNNQDAPTSSDGGNDAGAGDGGQAAACDFTDEKQFCACLALTCGGDTLADKAGAYHTVYCGTCDPANVCVAKATFAGGAAGKCMDLKGLTPAQKTIAEQLTSLWENSEPEIDYAYSENIDDGRGFTSGRAGFCTGTGDAIVVLACYNAAKPGNVLQKYMPALVTIQDAFIKTMGKTPQGTTTGLNNFAADWETAAADPLFRKCQDGVVDAVYYGLAMQHAHGKGFTTALTKAAFYDAQINMGNDDPNFGMKAMIAMADAKTGAIANPPTRDDESKWLANFLRIRAQIMYNDADTWRENMYRVANYEKLRAANNFDLTGCIRTGASSAATWPGSGFTSDPGPMANLGQCP